MLDIMPKNLLSKIQNLDYLLDLLLLILLRHCFGLILRIPLAILRKGLKLLGKLNAVGFGLAVVVTNQVVDLVGPNEGINGLRVGNLGCLYSSGRRVCLALGLAWANCVNSRLFLSRNDNFGGEENQIVNDDGEENQILCVVGQGGNFM